MRVRADMSKSRSAFVATLLTPRRYSACQSEPSLSHREIWDQRRGRANVTVTDEQRSQPRTGWVADAAAWFARIGSDPLDDVELRQQKALLVMVAILILPVSVVWGSLYLSFGSAVGVIPF